MSKSKNVVWRFFASVKLALISLIILAATSIIGTLIKQAQEPSFYIQEYGESAARFLQTLRLDAMYSSWWYIALLCLFAVNLIVCTIERLPGVWRLVVLDNTDITLGQLEKKSCSHSLATDLPVPAAVDRTLESLKQSGWKVTTQKSLGDSTLLFRQKGAWSRLGVYVVHLSILIILAGAIIGNLFGFQAYVFLPEGRPSEHVFLRKTKEPYPLGFKLQCDKFEKLLYDNGMAKQYRADLSIHSPELAIPLRKSVIVNDPLSYQGLTFYVGDSYPLQEYLVLIRNHATNQEQAFRVPTEQDVPWQGTTLSFRIDKLLLDQEGRASRAQIKLTAAGNSEPVTVQVAENGEVDTEISGIHFSIHFRQFQSVLLLVTRDPGVLTFYLGCALMVVGLAISLLLSHRRLWVHFSSTEKNGSSILISGTSNKNMVGFEQQFEHLIERINRDFPITKNRKKRHR